jgi:glycosyltransferase involved in cell wall biosynthesis
MKKVVMLLSNPFRPDPRVYKEAKTLIEDGYDVSILAWDREMRYEKVEDSDGINVERIRISSSYDNILDMILKLPFFWLCLFIKLIKRDFDIIHCHDFDTLPIGLFTAKLKEKKVVYDAHELYSGMIEKSVPNFVVTLVDSIERRLVRYTDHLIIAEENYKLYFPSISYTKVSVVLNCESLVSTTYIEPTSKTFTLIYLGALSNSRFLMELVEVAGNLKDVKLIIGGIGNLYNTLKKVRSSYSNVEFVGYVHPNKVIQYTQRSNGVACMINPKYKNNRIASATKQFEAMVCGRPIICTKGTKSGEITTQENCGLVIDYDKNSLRNAIIKLRDNPELCKELGQNALKAALEKYNWEIMAKRLISLYDSISTSNEATKMEESIL